MEWLISKMCRDTLKIQDEMWFIRFKSSGVFWLDLWGNAQKVRNTSYTCTKADIPEQDNIKKEGLIN